MKIKTAQLGEIEYKEEDVIHFNQGLFGFEDSKKFLYVQNDSDSLFSYLQSIDHPSTSFILVDGYEIIKGYKLEVSKEELKEIEIVEENRKEICTFLIVTVPKNIQNLTINLLGPIVINSTKRMGKQMISNNSKHTTQYKLLGESDVAEKAS